MIWSPDLQRKIASYWPGASEQQQVRDALAEYALAPYPMEFDRVALAVVKVSERRLDKFGEALALAKLDWRDILTMAEYPEEVKGDEASRARIRERNRAQYEAWLAE